MGRAGRCRRPELPEYVEKNYMSPFRNALIGVCTLALLAGCASTLGQREGTNSRPMNGNLYSPSARLYGDYLAASYANHLGDASARAQYFSRAFALTPEDLSLGRECVDSRPKCRGSIHSQELSPLKFMSSMDQQELAVSRTWCPFAGRAASTNKPLEYLGSSSSVDGISHRGHKFPDTRVGASWPWQSMKYALETFHPIRWG